MSTLFPTAYDAFVDPGPNDSISTVAHNLNHGQANDAIAGMQTYIGISSSVGAATLTGQIKALQALLPSTAAQNAVYAGPATGGTGAPSFRALVVADLPASVALLGATQTFTAAQTFSAGLTGNVTGNVSGSSGSCTGNAATATTAAACSGNAATATTAAACSGNAATATLAANSSQLLGSTWAAPAAIGGTTPAAGTFTVVTINAAVANAVLQLNAVAASNCNINFFVGGAGKHQFIGTTTGQLQFEDLVNSNTYFTYTPGAATTAVVTWSNTLDASSSTVAANVMSGGLAVAKSLQVGTSGTFGSTLSATTLTLSGGGPQIQVNAAAANSASIQLNGTTGNDAIVQFAVAGTIQQTMHGNVLGWYLNDNVNGWAPLQYQVGAIGAGDVIFNGTRDATSSTSAGVIMSGGLGVTKSLNVGTTGTFNTGWIIPNGSVIGSTAGFIGRRNTGADNGQAWGLSVSNAAASDNLTLAYASSTYSTGGVLTWVPNSYGYIYYPSNFRIGTTTGANAYAEFTSAAVNYGSSMIVSVLNVTAASSSTVGAFVVGNGTASTSVAIGGGTIIAGSAVTAAGLTSTGSTFPLTVTQSAAVSGSPYAVQVTGGADTTLTSGTEAIDINLGLNRIVQWATTTPATQRAVVILNPTYACNTASQTIGTAASLAIVAAPVPGTNVTISNSYALWIQAGSSKFAGAVIVSGVTNPLNITQSAGASGAPLALSFSFGAHTGLTSGTEVIDANVNLSRTVTWSATTPSTQRAFLFQPPTYACSAVSQTIANAATVAISGAPANGTNVTITNPWALWVQAGASLFTGGVTVGTAAALITSNVAMTGGSTSNTPTLTSGPVTGNPTKWIPINDNGTTRYVPAW